MDIPPSSPSKEEGVRLLKAGQLGEAIGVFESVVQSQPDDPQLHTYLGVAYNRKGDRLRAISHFEESLRLRETPQSYYNLGQIYESVNRVDEAVRQYRMAAEMDRGYTMAREALDRLHSKFEAEHPQPQPEPEQAQVGAGTWPGAEQTQAMPPGSGIPGVPPAAPTLYGAPPVSPHGMPPNLADIQREKDRKVREAHRQMMTSGLIYGAICGAIVFLLRSVLGAVMISAFASGGLAVVYLIIQAGIGAIFGALVGLWIGYTSGDDMSGALAGGVLGFLAGFLQLIGAGIGFAIVNGLFTAFWGAVGGFIIGKLVDASIGQV